MYSLALIIVVVSEKKAFEHFPISAGLSLTLDTMGKMFQNASSLTPFGQLKPNCPGMIIGRSSTNFLFFMTIGKKHKICRGPSNDHSWAVWFQLSKWFQRRSVLKHFSHRVQGKCSNAFFSETTNIIKAKLYMNVHWMVLYKLTFFVPI
jgi:hypothetical protein